MLRAPHLWHFCLIQRSGERGRAGAVKWLKLRKVVEFLQIQTQRLCRLLILGALTPKALSGLGVQLPRAGWERSGAAGTAAKVLRAQPVRPPQPESRPAETQGVPPSPRLASPHPRPFEGRRGTPATPWARRKESGTLPPRPSWPGRRRVAGARPPAHAPPARLRAPPPAPRLAPAPARSAPPAWRPTFGVRAGA